MTKAADLSFDAACQVDGILDAKFTSDFYFTFLCSDFSLEVRVDEDKCMCARRSLHSLDSTSGLRASEGPALGREGGQGRGKEGKGPSLPPPLSLFLLYCSHRRLPLLSPFLLTCGLVHESACSSGLCVSAIWVGKIERSRLANQVRSVYTWWVHAQVDPMDFYFIPSGLVAFPSQPALSSFPRFSIGRSAAVRRLSPDQRPFTLLCIAL